MTYSLPCDFRPKDIDSTCKIIHSVSPFVPSAQKINKRSYDLSCVFRPTKQTQHMQKTHLSLAHRPLTAQFAKNILTICRAIPVQRTSTAHQTSYIASARSSP
eukprot:608487-Hanusia_phi.AAC.1